jgi:metal-sulfur cluster biosynthetic enzyme/nitrite reductase/ring-hydroxylating ferredoxin subunit
MPEFEQVASVDEVQPGGRLSVFVDDIPVLLLQHDDGTYAAVEDVCTHDGQPLTDGPVSAGEITCPRHGARFDLRTGQAKCMPATEAVPIYDVKIEGNGIWLKLCECDHASFVGAQPVTSLQTQSQSQSADASSPDEGAADAAEVDASEDDDREKSVDEKMIDALRTVIDPELMVNIVDLGLVYSINHDGQKAYVDMTLTSPACPVGPQIVQQSKMALERLRNVDEAEIKLVMTPPWSPERMTDEARDHLGIF